MTEALSPQSADPGFGCAEPERLPYLSFDRVASDYDLSRYLPPQAMEEAARVLQDNARFEPGRPLLDAGVGTGRFALPLARLGVTVVGLDISEKMLARLRDKSAEPRRRSQDVANEKPARINSVSSRDSGQAAAAHFAEAEEGERPLPLRLARADLRRMPIASNSCSAVLLVHVLHLVADWKAVLAEAKRVLAPGGVLFLAQEAGKRLPTRDTYLDMARSRGVLQGALGADSVDTIHRFLGDSGAKVDRVDTDRVYWTASWRVDETLEMLRRRIWSHMWSVPESDHEQLMAATEDWARRTYSALDTREEVEALLRIWTVRWNQDDR